MTSHRQRVIRADGRTLNIMQHRGHLSYCFTGCCGRTERGYAEVPVDIYKEEWIKRKIRNQVHLTKGGCLGPCSLANVACLVGLPGEFSYQRSTSKTGMRGALEWVRQRSTAQSRS